MILQLPNISKLLMLSGLGYALVLCLLIVAGMDMALLLAAGLPAIAIVLYLAIYRPRDFGILLVFLIPLSITLNQTPLGFGISLPSEILILIAAVLTALNLIWGHGISKDLLLHPVSIAIYLHLIWIAITTLSSTMPLVSAKFLFIRVLYILVFYLFFAQIFSSRQGLQIWTWAIMVPLSFVIGFILVKHAQYGFIQQVNFYVTRPFFNDHTIYGAVLAMIFPLVAVNLFIPKHERRISGWISGLFSLLLLIGIFFSYSRAVWIGMAFIPTALAILYLRISFKSIILMIIAIMALGYYFREPITERMKGVESERGSDIKEHAASVVNLNSSASNMERVNRWESALAMYREKPILGFGPGTYPFQYGPYQKEENLTRISTYFGDKGGAHSEYLKPLSESGLPGLLSFVLIILLTLRSALRVIYKQSYGWEKLMATALILGLSTYYIHGFFNFFLDTAKTSALFWGLTAFIVVLEIRTRKEQHPDKLVTHKEFRNNK